MSVTEFAMVEELAFLVKDNLRCKHLVLSMEETFLNFLQDDSSHFDGILELQPMDAYNRLLLHRLADIFGFSHVSIGEGANRHLILERCPETSMYATCFTISVTRFLLISFIQFAALHTMVFLWISVLCWVSI
ncbi:RNA-BINDING SUPPRESSOR OF PAS KINASE PROTEIN 1 [Salix koriyanagi]|uniref:RNA-BINDING SUPPRESSOR OF PAS KINASE PROTEIN 1 n=1 Tax=Salix koriyanagi TaxID=2511006 RepID=A0A9Q1A6F0_9ROSI|nr:RNA-BINDING SUPPRESSOR OF PAS KINASE PROTEIN 1 [Salix koriyanagi]